ncbi:Zinc finger, RING/FYVE/PHD-type [Artemisia annua]|uniref:RING-type E3 ubiquitin transferase n=1 Tax=Artemisia annua TaxID=35608 RepID=A0A2U1PL24_ARTAN|nr:Zinc finger, RING/FYVE/PHD-type [Artemisia annua]
MCATYTGYRYPDPEHMLLCLGSGVNYKPVRAYSFYHIVITEFDKIAESVPYPHPDPDYIYLYPPNNENSMPTDGENLMPVCPYFVLYMNANYEFDPEKVAESLRCYYPKDFPYTWHVYQRQAIIVNQIDLDVYRSCNGLPKLPSSPSHDDDYPYKSPYRDLNPPFCADEEESLEQALKQLRITKSDIISNDLESWFVCYAWKRKDDGHEVCVICQAEFEIGEEIRFIGCREHGYHQSCIKEWLKVKNECPICRFPGYFISWSWK